MADQIKISNLIPGSVYFGGYLDDIMSTLAQNLPKPNNIADIGCGNGIHLIELLKVFPEASGWGFDPSKACISFAKERAKRAGNATFLTGTAQEVSEKFKARFDLVFCNQIAPFVPDLRDLVKDLASLLSPKGGYIAVRDFALPDSMSLAEKQLYSEFIGESVRAGFSALTQSEWKSLLVENNWILIEERYLPIPLNVPESQRFPTDSNARSYWNQKNTARQKAFVNLVTSMNLNPSEYTPFYPSFLWILRSQN